ncbi:hypothetical protein BDM02DRAFT_3118731, partial [Thelephora ganbajun]
VFCSWLDKVSSALKRNRREITLGHLRARKQPEDILIKRSKAPENPEPTFWTVEHAADQQDDGRGLRMRRMPT